MEVHFLCIRCSSSVAGLISLYFYWSSDPVVAIVSKASGMVPVVCSSRVSSHSCMPCEGCYHLKTFVVPCN